MFRTSSRPPCTSFAIRHLVARSSRPRTIPQGTRLKLPVVDLGVGGRVRLLDLFLQRVIIVRREKITEYFMGPETSESLLENDSRTKNFV